MSRTQGVKNGIWQTGLGIVIALLCLFHGAPAEANTYYVTTLTDRCDAVVIGGLRLAISSANSHAGPDTIRFDGLSGTITPPCDLPKLRDSGTLIMGETSATGAGGIVIDGGDSIAVGLHMAGESCVIRGLEVKRFSDCGVLIEPLTDGIARHNLLGGQDAGHQNTIRYNRVGIKLSGSPCDSNTVYNNRANNNTEHGIHLVDGPTDNVIGGTSGSEPNVASVNGVHGIYLEGAVQGTKIRGNHVGTDIGGTIARGNSQDGIRLEGSQCSYNEVTKNQVCDSEVDGIVISGGYANTISNNIIGLDYLALSALGNQDDGILVTLDACENQIGPDNVVSGNGGDGIEISSTTLCNGNYVYWNIVGLNIDRLDSIPNHENGVFLNTTANCDVWENTVSGNRLNGVKISGASLNNTIRDNHIGTTYYYNRMGNKWQGILVENCGWYAQNTLISGNVIADNSSGVLIAESCDSIQFYGNQVGTDPTGTIILRNNCGGVIISSTGNLIGGIEDGQGNLIKYNIHNGIWMYNYSSAQSNNLIRGNNIEHNSYAGVLIYDGMLNNAIGGSSLGEPEAENIIMYNGLDGIACGYSGALNPPVGNCFMSNSIHGNGGLGISLLTTVPPGNDGIPAPTITSARTTGADGVTNLGGNDTMVQLFVNGTGDEGYLLVAEFLVTGTDLWSYHGPLPDTENLTATNTGRWPTSTSDWETSEFSAPVLIVPSSDVEDQVVEVPSVFRMGDISPNPFRASARIGYDIPRAGRVSLKVYDTTGRLVRSLFDGPAAPGTHDVTWDASDDRGRVVAPGVYFCRFEHADGSEVREIIYAR